MRDLINALAIFNTGIHNSDTMLKKRRQIPARDVTILVDGRSQYRAAMIAVPNGIVGAATEERDSKWGSANDHGYASFPPLRGDQSIDLRQIDLLRQNPPVPRF